MSYSEIEVWLLNTILGLIVLGAIGSIAGSIFLWIVVKMAKASVGFLVEKSNQMLSSFIVNITISYMRSYLRARELVNIAHTKPTVVPIGILYAKTLRRQFFYSSFAALCFFISVMLFVLFGVEYPKHQYFLLP